MAAKDGRTRIIVFALAMYAAAPLLRLTSSVAFAQETTRGAIAGVVQDEQQQPIPHATITVGGRAGQTTDESGRFRLEALTGDTVVIRVTRVGYTPVSLTVRVGAQDVRVTMARTTVNLSAVVVTGTAGGVEKKAIGNAVTSIDAADAKRLSGANDIGALLNGRAAGVVVVPNGGRVGVGPSITTRGRSSLTLSGEPLIYIDGVRTNNETGTGPTNQGNRIISRLGDLNPDDIESFEVIRGPAAATIYGTEAANGVIQILTKRGRGNRAEIRGLMRQGTSWFANQEALVGERWGRNPQGAVETWNPIIAEKDRGTPIFRPGHLQGYGLSMSGGAPPTGAIRYFLSSNYDFDHGIDPVNKGKRFGSRANVDVMASDAFDVKSGFSLVRSDVNLSQDGASRGSALYNAVLGRVENLYPAAGEPNRRGFFRAPPEYFYGGQYRNTQAIARMIGSLEMNHRPTSWLSQRGVIGYDHTAEENQATYGYMSADMAPYFPASEQRGRYDNVLREVEVFTADYSATARVRVRGDVEASTSFGGQMYRTNSVGMRASGLDFPGPGVLSPGTTATNLVTTVPRVTNTTLGLYGQEQFDWGGRRFVTLALRIDNNSAFGGNFKTAMYPKVSGSWVLSDEPFWSIGAIPTLRLRVAYGLSGQQPAAFAALRTFGATTGPNDQPAVTPAFVGNPDLKPERGRELEMGFEVSMFERLDVDFTAYRRVTNDVILARTAAPSGGFPSEQFFNAGRTSNNGIEMQATGHIVRGARMSWDVGLNLATTRDRIEQLGGLSSITIAPGQRHVEGYPIGGLWTKQIVSATLNATGQATNLLCSPGSAGGAPVACASAPLVFMGTITPKQTGAITTSATFGRLRLGAMADFRRGHKLVWTDGESQCFIARSCEVNFYPERFDTKYVASVQNGFPANLAEAFIRDASFTKLREISAGVSLSERHARYARARSGNLTFAARNLASWTRWPGLDPEGRSGSQTLQATTNTVTPQLAQLIATLTLVY